MSGRDLSRRFYVEVIRPAVVDVLGEAPYAAAMLCDGSDVLGDDGIGLADWLTAPTQILATLWRCVLAAGWLRIGPRMSLSSDAPAALATTSARESSRRRP